jgi:hypothetical protein
LKTLIAQADHTDPFMAGAPWRKERAEWFAAQWVRFSVPPGTHVRRFHYLLVSQSPPIPMPDGEPYLNTERCYKNLIIASIAARKKEFVAYKSHARFCGKKCGNDWRYQRHPLKRQRQAARAS